MRWKIPLFEPDLGDAEIGAVADVIRSRWLTLGAQTAEFEKKFAAFSGTRFAVAVSSGTAALHLALRALGIEEGDDVVCPALTFVATANAARYCGARPVFADIRSLDDWNVSAETIERVLTPRTRAVIVVHYAGYLPDMAAIAKLCKDRGLRLVEDAAHAPGASRDGRAAGSWGDAGCFSFFPNKNMTTGEGGMVTTDDPEIATRIGRLRSHAMTSLTADRFSGRSKTYDVVDLGYNYRMTEMNAVLGLAQLERLEERNSLRRKLVREYEDLLHALGGVRVPFRDARGEPSCHIQPVLLPESVDRDRVVDSLWSDGIQTSVHYRAVDTLSAYVKEGLGPSSEIARTHMVADRELTLPLFPSMASSQIQTVCEALERALARGGRRREEA